MANSYQLRENINQHKPKNTLSKEDDKNMLNAVNRVMRDLTLSLNLEEKKYYLEHVKEIKLKKLINFIKKSQGNKRNDYANLSKIKTSSMKPDGGFILLKKENDKEYEKIVLVSEMKRQGTNDKRKEEGKKKQAKGNAIERLGKNLIGIKTVLRNERITPFVCFGWGIDFEEGSSINDRIVVLNEFYKLNKIYVFKKEETNDSPVSMYFRKDKWTENEIYPIIKEITESSIKYYLYS